MCLGREPEKMELTLVIISPRLVVLKCIRKNKLVFGCLHIRTQSTHSLINKHDVLRHCAHSCASTFSISSIGFDPHHKHRRRNRYWLDHQAPLFRVQRREEGKSSAWLPYTFVNFNAYPMCVWPDRAAAKPEITTFVTSVTARTRQHFTTTHTIGKCPQVIAMNR